MADTAEVDDKPLNRDSSISIDDLLVIGLKCSITRDPKHQCDESLVIWNNTSEARILWIDKYDARAIIEDKETLKRVRTGQTDQGSTAETELLFNELRNSEDVEEENSDLYIDLMYERYRDMINAKSCDSENKVTQPPSEVEVSSSPQEIMQTRQIDDNTDSTLAYTNENFSYRSYREELWIKPARDNYHISNYVSEHENISWPMTKKQYDVILHTVKSIRQHGEQFEILLKVKHADDDFIFDFLNIDSPMHALFQLLKSLEEKIFWHVILGRDREVESEVMEKTDNTQASALQLIGNLYDDDDDDDDGNDNGALEDDGKIGINLVGPDDASLHKAEVSPDMITSLNGSQSMGESNSAHLTAAVLMNDTKEDGEECGCLEEATLAGEGDPSIDQDTVAIDHLEEGKETIERRIPSAVQNTSIQSEEECNTNTGADDCTDPDYDPINDDDLLDEDVDEDKPWGIHHLKKKEFERRKVQVARLAKAKEMRQRFSMIGAISTDKVSGEGTSESKDAKNPEQVAKNLPTSSSSSESEGSRERSRKRVRSISSNSSSSSGSSSSSSSSSSSRVSDRSPVVSRSRQSRRRSSSVDPNEKPSTRRAAAESLRSRSRDRDLHRRRSRSREDSRQRRRRRDASEESIRDGRDKGRSRERRRGMELSPVRDAGRREGRRSSRGRDVPRDRSRDGGRGKDTDRGGNRDRERDRDRDRDEGRDSRTRDRDRRSERGTRERGRKRYESVERRRRASRSTERSRPARHHSRSRSRSRSRSSSEDTTRKKQRRVGDLDQDPPPSKQFITSFEVTKGTATASTGAKASLSFREKVKLALMEIT